MKRTIISVFLTISLIMPFASVFNISFAKSGDTIKGNPVSIYDSITGCTYNYINFNGEELLRPYMGMQSWTTDGKGFVCGVQGKTMETGTIYVYNTETNEFTVVGTGNVYTTHIEAVIGTDNCVYYSSDSDIFRYNIKTKETTVVLPSTMGFDPIALTISNDCQYISFSSGINKDYWCDEGETAIFRYNIPKKEIECLTHKFEYSNFLTHQQINPDNPDIVFFAHEAVIGDGEGEVPNYWSIYDREWSADFNTGEIKNVFKQGKTDSDTCILFTTHESWSASGKYLYINCYSNENENGKGKCIIRCYPDGSHREFLTNTHSNPDLSVDHAMASGDDKFTVVDSNGGRYVYVLSNDTYEQFPIYYSATGHMETDENGNATSVDKGHPYHPHPNVARNHYKVDWGMEHEGVVGIAWYDFTEIARNDVASGGRYPVNEYIDRVSYSGLDCATEDIVYHGKEANHAVSDKYLYYDINEIVVDGVNEDITLSFDYFDNTTNDLNLIYTDGVVTDNDFADSEDAKITIKRTGTNEWIHKEIKINGNFENINPYRTDFKIGGSADTYISNLEVKGAPDASEIYAGGDGTKENPYQIANVEQLKYFTNSVRTTTDKTEVDSNISYTATKVSDTSVTATYAPKRYHVFTDKYFELTDDINLSGETWTPVGNLVNVFNGHFDGNGHVISNIYIDGTKPVQFERYAFFGATGADAEITNLGLEKLTNKFKCLDSEYSATINNEAYTYTDRLVGCAGFVSSYAGGTFRNCYLKNAEIRDLSPRMSSAGTGGFFGLGYGTVKATAENGYNAMTVTNCYVNGAMLRSHSYSYGFIAYDVKPNTVNQLDDNDVYHITKTLKNCYTANIRRGYYDNNSLYDKNGLIYDGLMYPFTGTGFKTTYINCYTTSKGEQTDTSGISEVSDRALTPTAIETLNAGLVDNSNFYTDVKEKNNGYPIHTDMSALDIWDGTTDKKPKGKGTEENPYLISTKEELVWFGNSVNTISDEGIENGYTSEADSYFKLISDIDLEGNEWEPVGNTKVAFKGHFDGNGHVIKNFKIRSFEENYTEAYATADATEKSKFCTDKIYKYIGFFGRTTKGAVVSNLGIENAKINFWSHDYYYELKVDESGVVTDKNSIRAADTGGMVGYAFGGQFINCYVKNCEIKNMQRSIRDSGVAGFAGLASWDASFIGCYVKNAVLSSSIYTTISGFANNIANSVTCTDCYVSNVMEDRSSYFSVLSTAYGFAKGDASAKITQCYSDMTDFASEASGAEGYNSNRSLGIVSTTDDPVTKEEIENGVTANQNLIADTSDNFNDGYPVCVWQNVLFKNYVFSTIKDGVSEQWFVSDSVIDEVSFYKNRAVSDCYMYTVLYDKSDNDRMLGCSIDFIDDSELSAKSTHTIKLSTPITVPDADTTRYALKLIFTNGEKTFTPICDNFEYFE
ncbi:MAG: hypothetical protein IJC09_04915 [Clostridia bacterium]|nr:hypothetical protein [Clostridia bacterium]